MPSTKLASEGARMRPLERLIIAMAVEFTDVSRPQQRTQVEASHLAFAFYGLGVTPVFVPNRCAQ